MSETVEQVKESGILGLVWQWWQNLEHIEPYPTYT